jgi:hypothetical protein
MTAANLGETTIPFEQTLADMLEARRRKIRLLTLFECRSATSAEAIILDATPGAHRFGCLPRRQVRRGEVEARFEADDRRAWRARLDTKTALTDKASIAVELNRRPSGLPQ